MPYQQLVAICLNPVYLSCLIWKSYVLDMNCLTKPSFKLLSGTSFTLRNSAMTCRMPPWANRWLLAAIGLSMALHSFILYVPWAALLFSVTPLDREEWAAILCLSFPVIILDEVLKVATRYCHLLSGEMCFCKECEGISVTQCILSTKK